VELQTVEPDLRVLRVIKSLLRLELLLDVGVALDSGHADVRLEHARAVGGVSVDFLQRGIFDGPAYDSRRRVIGSADAAASRERAVGGVGAAVPGSGTIEYPTLEEVYGDATY